MYQTPIWIQKNKYTGIIIQVHGYSLTAYLLPDGSYGFPVYDKPNHFLPIKEWVRQQISDRMADAYIFDRFILSIEALLVNAIEDAIFNKIEIKYKEATE